nr:uncharacterized protein LOC128686057 isoform X1 [Cherax quadricarinatus]XP_053628676.1 uncharacterized protein LOC128686057 isoform X1 [Cherax quadricarinatus]
MACVFTAMACMFTVAYVFTTTTTTTTTTMPCVNHHKVLCVQAHHHGLCVHHHGLCASLGTNSLMNCKMAAAVTSSMHKMECVDSQEGTTTSNVCKIKCVEHSGITNNVCKMAATVTSSMCKMECVEL